MTRRRDRYQSWFGAGIPGTRSAIYDIGLALYLLERFAKEHALLRERLTLSARSAQCGESWTVAQLLEIARDALNTSVGPAVHIYERLQENEEAARLVVEADIFSDEKWQHLSEALTDTLNNHAIISRGFVSGARRIIARREIAKRAKGTGDAA